MIKYVLILITTVVLFSGCHAYHSAHVVIPVVKHHNVHSGVYYKHPKHYKKYNHHRYYRNYYYRSYNKPYNKHYHRKHR